MRFLHTLLTDLRERQIFPAVVLLAVLAIAIPIVASSTLSKVSVAAPLPIAPLHLPAPKGVKAPLAELAALNSTTNSSTTRHGAEPNPFREAGTSTASTTAPSSHTTTKSSGATTTPTATTVPTTPAKTTPAKTKPKSATKPAGGSGSSGSSSPAKGTPVTGPASLKADEAYTVDIDTKDATGLHVLSDVVRLAPLPAAQSPEVIFLGVLQGGTKAAFLFTNAIAVSGKIGDGLTCLPSTSDCQIVELSPGQGLSLYPTANTALIATFTFELVSIGSSSYSTDSAATQARDAVSSAGQTLLPLSQSSALETLSFDSKVGALVHHSAPSGGSSGAGASGTTGASGSTGATGASGGGDDEVAGLAFAVKPAG